MTIEERMNKIKIGSTSLDNQIAYMELSLAIIKSPISIAILNSLKELKGIKQKNIPKK